VSHAYGARTALDRVGFTLAPARFLALLGLNGAGKSTLFSLITRLYPLRAGRIRIFGHDVAREPSAALRRLGVVFQARTLDLDLSVAQNLAYHAALHGIGSRAASRLAADALAQIGLAERVHDKVRALSGGQMRRVEIARALMHAPPLLILDEPTVGLDIKARAEILAHVRMLVRERGVAVVWATHLVDEIADDDALIVLHRGRILADGPVAQVVAQANAANVRDAFTRLTRDAQDDAA
ncbi:MAG TPA: ABC transporter ATP-binding protein, partial [Xanthobacteraceae bacterium]|nr:ABC transporter ATP-binding protein [Xanthobacteraceae bacterium]